MTDLRPRSRPLRASDRPPAPVPAARRRPPSEVDRSTNPARIAVLAALVVLAGIGGGWPLLAMIAALVVMIFLHELGHYLTAKWAGMKVTEFFIGFGPRVWSFQRGETEYGIKAIPAGAYVKIIGMNNLDEFDPADADRTYMSKPFWRRLSVAVAGSTMHFLLAAVCLFVALGFVGVPGGALASSQDELDAIEQTSSWTVDQVSPGSGADEAGITVGDRIVAIDGEGVDGFGSFSDIVRERANEVVPVVVRRDGTERTVDVRIGRREDDRDAGFFGVGPRIEAETTGVVDAVGETGRQFGSIVGQAFTGLTHLLSPSGIADIAGDAFSSEEPGPAVGGGGSGGDGEASEGPQAAGIIRISDIGAGLLDDGEFGYWLAVFAAINIFIGLFNLVPLLPLDGGHVAIAVYEKVQAMRKGVKHYHVDVVKLLPVTYAVVVVLAFLMVSIVILDTRTIVGG